MRILVIEDSPDLVANLCDFLEARGHSVDIAYDAPAGLRLAQGGGHDVIVLDLMLPGMDGLEVCRELKGDARTRAIPVVIITARGEESDVVAGLELGADDYVTKPFSPRELTARVRAVLRRVEKQSSAPEMLRAGNIQVDRSGRSTLINGQPVDLTPSEFELLATLMAAPGRVFSRLELLDRLQGTAYEGYERTIDVHIRNLRAKIEPDASNPQYIETVYGAGYRFASRE